MAQPALTKNAYAYQSVRERIMNGSLPAGEALAQSQLAADIGVSLTPMREALRKLEAEGLVTIDAHRNAKVAPLTAHEATNLFQVRERLDPMAAFLAAENRNEHDIAQIRDAAEKMKPLANTSDLDALAAHREFHRAIYRASHNDLLVSMLESLWDKADRYRQVGLSARKDSAADTQRIAGEHERIMQAVISGEPETAEAEMTAHVRGSLGRRAIDALTSPAP
ncbi:GntR family transcriptional regulator [Glutamicibacter sp. NPDC087344]|uniref:GntR family transcriptional regulator n=1 Tax=Glutamicibacter sp. NPDC087344 TaxID=3363994 RepID=UPI00380F1BB5